MAATFPGDFTADKKGTRGKNAKRITWVLLLKAHKVVSCLTSLAVTAADVASEPESDTKKEDPKFRSRFYTSIKLFLWLSVLLLGFEIVVFKGFHIGTSELQRLMAVSSSFGLSNLFDSLYSGWVHVRTTYLAPLLQFLANACIILFLVQSADRLILCFGCLWIRFKRIKPELKPVTELEDEESTGEPSQWCSSRCPCAMRKSCKHPIVIVVEMDRILRPGGWAIIREKLNILNPLEAIFRSLHWDVRMTYAKDREGIICVQKTKWRPQSA